MGVELANPAAAAIAVIIITVVGGNRAANHSRADETCSKASAEASGICPGGGCNGAGHGERGESESGHSGFDRHAKLDPV